MNMRIVIVGARQKFAFLTFKYLPILFECRRGYLCADKIAPDSIYKTRTKSRRQKISALQQTPAPKAEIHYLENPALRHT